MSENGQETPGDKSALWKLIHLNPARWIALVVAVAAVLAAFGLAISDEQKAAITGLIVAVTAILQGMWTESKTTANSKVVVTAPDPVAQPHLVEPGNAITEAKVVDILNAAQTTPKHRASE